MHNIKQLYSIHFGRAVVYTLLSLFLFMAAGKVYAEERNPVVKIDNTSYTSSGTEVTLRLWMFNDSNPFTNYSARFTGEVNLYIDDQVVIKLNSIWSSIAGAKRETIFTAFTDKPVDINIDGTNVGTAQFNNLQYGQTCPDNSNTTDNSWYTVDLKLSFNKSFSYYGHKITVKGKWQDKSSGSVVEKDVALDNTINGFVRPVNLKAQPSGSNMVFSWEQQGYNPSASTDGKWIVYKREGDNNVKLGEVAANEQSLSVENVLFSCSNDYIVAFLPDACKGAETVCGLTTSIGGKAHQINADDICQICGHSFFRYHTSDGNKVDISGKDFGAKVVSHKVIDSECVIEFDAPITRIPKQAFNNCKNLTGNLVIPNSVTEIGDQAFAGCTGFTGDLTIPNSVTNIGISAFYNCTGFTGNLTIPNSVTTIEAKAFANCYGFTGNLVIPESVTTIRASVFAGCNGFTGKLTIPNSVTTIGNLAFSGCKGFTGDLLLPKSLEAVGIRSFNKCYNIQTINFQSLLKGIDNLNKKTVSLSDYSYISDMARGTVNEISYTRTMTSNWGTLVLPYPLTLTGNEPYRLYSIDNMTGEELVLKQLEGVVAAGTPCIIRRIGTESELTFGANKAALKMAIDDQPMDGMNFSGTYWTKDVTNGYIIAKDCFWNVEKLKGVGSVTAVKVRPFRAWLDGTSANAPAQLSMRIDGSATGIDAIDTLNDAEAEYYDLSGKRLDEPQRGVNIVRMKSGKTKKIIIK